MSDEEAEIILSELNDAELVEQMHDDLYDGLKEEIEEGTNILLERGWEPYKVLTEALVEGMRIVGIDFRDGILFVPEVLMAANAMKGGMSILRPLLAETGAPPIGTVVIGTVKGDIHDIGKNLVSTPAAFQQYVGAFFNFLFKAVVEVIVHLLDQLVIVELGENDLFFVVVLFFRHRFLLRLRHCPKALDRMVVRF